MSRRRVRKLGRRLAFVVRHPRAAARRVRFGRDTFTHAPWSQIDGYIDVGSVIVEAGAADGSDTAVLARRYPQAQIIACEPASRSFDMLVKATGGLPNVTRRRLALGAAVGTAELHLACAEGSGSADSSSLLAPTRHEELYPHVSFQGSETVEVTTLDVLAESLEVAPMFLWLDLQGAELLVLRASPQVRGSARAIYMEVCRVSMYDGMPTYPVVVRQMNDWGFSVDVDRVGAEAGNILFRRNF
jgi:FkbM family methyltransferase